MIALQVCQLIFVCLQCSFKYKTGLKQQQIREAVASNKCERICEKEKGRWGEWGWKSLSFSWYDVLHNENLNLAKNSAQR